MSGDRLEKERRIYYQDIVYKVCNIIDAHRGKRSMLACGTIDAPHDEVQVAVKELTATITTLQAQVKELRERLIYILDRGWRMVYMGIRYNQLKIAVSDQTKEWLEQGRITTPHSAGRRVEKLEVVARKLVEDSTPYAGDDPQYALVDVRLIEDLTAALDEAKEEEDKPLFEGKWAGCMGPIDETEGERDG